MKKKFNETMVTRNGKLIYAIQLKSKANSDRSFIYIYNGEVYFSDSYFSSTEFDFNDDTHRIAKEIFINQLQTDIKRRVLELKQLEEIFKDLNLSECVSDIIPNSAKILSEVKKDVLVTLDNKIVSIEEKINENIEEKMESVVEENVKSIARKRKKKKEEEDK